MKIFTSLLIVALVIFFYAGNLSTVLAQSGTISQVSSTVIFHDRFSGANIDTSKWIPTGGWSQNDVLTVNGGGIGYTKKSDFKDFILDVDFQILPHNGYEYLSLILRQEPNNPFVGTYYMVQLGSKTSFADPNMIRISKGIDLVKTVPIPFDINTGQWYHLKLVLQQYSFQFFVNGQFIGLWNDVQPVNSGGVHMRRWGAIGINAAGIPGDALSDWVNYDNLMVSNP